MKLNIREIVDGKSKARSIEYEGKPECFYERTGEYIPHGETAPIFGCDVVWCYYQAGKRVATISVSRGNGGIRPPEANRLRRSWPVRVEIVNTSDRDEKWGVGWHSQGTAWLEAEDGPHKEPLALAPYFSDEVFVHPGDNDFFDATENISQAARDWIVHTDASRTAAFLAAQHTPEAEGRKAAEDAWNKHGIVGSLSGYRRLSDDFLDRLKENGEWNTLRRFAQEKEEHQRFILACDPETVTNASDRRTLRGLQNALRSQEDASGVPTRADIQALEKQLRSHHATSMARATQHDKAHRDMQGSLSSIAEDVATKRAAVKGDSNARLRLEVTALRDAECPNDKAALDRITTKHMIEVVRTGKSPYIPRKAYRDRIRRALKPHARPEALGRSDFDEGEWNRVRRNLERRYYLRAPRTPKKVSATRKRAKRSSAD